MDIDRRVGFAPHVEQVAKALSEMPEPCIGCTECQGMCRELIDVITVPDALQKKKDTP